MEVSDLPLDKKIILFDGICNLCDSSVRFIINHDSQDVFRYVALQSELGIKIVHHLGIHSAKVDSIILYIPYKTYYTKISAITRIAKELNSWHRFLSIFRFTGTLGNFIYDFVAKNRYKWFGKKATCMISDTNVAVKFLS
ncbi:MAG: DCC1-like thiol-disulfide oxidoreductase family protein [Flavobacterium sp.]